MARSVPKLRSEVDWGMRQDPAACRADAAVCLAERGFASAAALAAGKVPCGSGAPAQAMNTEDLSVRQPNTSRGAATADVGSSDVLETADARGKAVGGGQEQQRHGDPEVFAWDAGLLAYECPLFARKFPANTSSQVLYTFGKFLV